MSVRTRVAVAVLAVALPAIVLVFLTSRSARRDAALGATAAVIQERMENAGRALCEADPARFGKGPGRRGRRGPLAGTRVFAYDAALRPANRRAPRLGPDVAEELEADGVARVGGGFGHPGAVAVRMPWRQGPCAVILVQQPHGPIHPPGQRPPLREAIVALGVLALALGVALVALGPPLGRLRRLSREVRQSARGGYLHPTTVGGRDEIGEVARAFDEAAHRVREHVERIEERDRALTGYVDATTHDLAIPLTVLQGRLSEAERQLREAGKADPALLAGALAECQYLDQLVGNMAAAAALEAGEPHLQRAPLDLVALIERVVARFRPVAQHGGVSLEYAVPDAPAAIVGDDILLERAVGNLVHNALRHRGAGAGPGRVALVLETPRPADETTPGRFRITVLDDGPGADDALLAKLQRGEPVQGPASARGRGLGLRIVRAVIGAHGLDLAFARGPEGGLEVRIEGPLAGDARGRSSAFPESPGDGLR